MNISRIILIDAHALCYRAFYAVRELKNSKGQPTNAVFGFLNILRKLKKDLAPEYMAACFDVGKKTLRQERYSDYKIQRPSMPEDLAVQIPIIKDVFSAYRIPVLEKEGYEADDVLATLASRFRAEGREIVIVSDDKDMYQLITEGVCMYSPRREMMIGPGEAETRFGVTPSHMLDYLALAGDASDNIPGIEGIGEVTARKLIQEYGTLENVLANADHLKGKLGEKVIKGRESALLSRELASLEHELDVSCSLDDIRVQEPDTDRLKHIFDELEFKGFLRELKTGDPQSQGTTPDKEKKSPLSFEMSPSPESVDPVDIGPVSGDVSAFVREAQKAGSAAVFFEHGANDAGDLFSGFSAAVGRSVYQLAPEHMEELRTLWQDASVRKIVYDLKHIRQKFTENGTVLKGEVFDVLLAGYLLSSGRSSHELAALAWTYLKRPLPQDGFSFHAARALADLEPVLQGELSLTKTDLLYRDMELPLSQVLFEMESEGVRLDVKLLEGLSGTCDERIAGMTEKIFELAGERFNLNSPKQLGGILFDKLKLPVIKKTKTGYSTDEEVLTRLSPQHELPAMLLEYRQLAKLKSTYIDALPRLVDARTGRLHCSFEQTGTETGRLSSRHPNLQNIPIRTEMGREIRRAFVPSAPGKVLVSVDYSQIELRVLAHLADEPALKKAFVEDEDIHTFTAGLIFDVAQKEVTRDMRYSAKRINFGIIYGMSAFGLAKDLGVANKEAQSFIDRYFLRYPGIRVFMENEIEKARALGYSETLLGRRRYLPDIQSRNPAIRQFAERQAINTPVQGTAADLIKAAMVLVARRIREEGLLSRMIITVHDELVFDVPQEELGRLVSLVSEAMENVIRLSVPVKVSVKAGMNWADMEPV